MTMKKFLAALAGLALLAGLAVAQVPSVPRVTSIGTTDLVQIIPNGAPTAGNVYASALQLQSWLLGGNSQRTGATAPALTSCGTGSPAISGNDTAGVVTAGTSATGCVVTFNTAYAAAPYCAVTSQSQLTSFAYSISATAITVAQTSTSGNLFNYVCMARAGG